MLIIWDITVKPCIPKGYFCYLRKKCLNLDFISLEYYHWYNMWLYEFKICIYWNVDTHTMKSFWILNFHEMTLQHVLYKTNYIVINIESNCKLMLINTQELSQWTSVTVTVNFLSCVSYFLLLTLYPALSKITYKSILHVIDISHVSQKYIKNYCSFEFSSTDLQEKKHNMFF